MIFLLCLMSVPGFYAYFFTDWRNNSFFRDASQRKIGPEFQKKSRIFNGRIVLRKDKSITVNRSRLVFKGLKDRMIHLEVFLLEFDPDSAYSHFISKADAQKGICVGDSKYQLLKVNKKTLHLKIIDLFKF